MSDHERLQVNTEQVRLFKKKDRVEWMLQKNEKGEGWAGEVLQDQERGGNVNVRLDDPERKRYRPPFYVSDWLEAKNLNLLSKS